MTNEQKESRIEEILEGLSYEEIVDVWNAYCEDANYWDDVIRPMYMLDEELEGKTPMEVLEMFNGCDFNTNDSWYWYNGYGNPESSDNPFDHVSIFDLSRYSVSHEEDFGILEILEVLEESEESEES